MLAEGVLMCDSLLTIMSVIARFGMLMGTARSVRSCVRIMLMLSTTPMTMLPPPDDLSSTRSPTTNGRVRYCGAPRRALQRAARLIT